MFPMGSGLPAWVVEDVESVRRESLPYRSMSDEERLRLLAASCRAMSRLLAAREDADLVLRLVDPVPASTRRILARLRRQAGSRKGGEGE